MPKMLLSLTGLHGIGENTDDNFIYTFGLAFGSSNEGVIITCELAQGANKLLNALLILSGENMSRSSFFGYISGFT